MDLEKGNEDLEKGNEEETFSSSSKDQEASNRADRAELCVQFQQLEYECDPELMLDDARIPEEEARQKSERMRQKEATDDDNDTTSSFSCWPCRSWSRERAQLTIMGCTSSCVVLAVRLYLDREPLAYLIHSIIVFLDMILIHLFTNTWWLSLSGEIVTYASFLLFHFEKETIYELLETTLIAVLCSFQMIASRSEVKDTNAKLQGDLRQLRRQTALIMRRSTMLEEDDERASELDHLTKETREAIAAAKEMDDRNALDTLLHDPEYREKATICGERFFEHFLDGSAGVMVRTLCYLKATSTFPSFHSLTRTCSS